MLENKRKRPAADVVCFGGGEVCKRERFGRPYGKISNTKQVSFRNLRGRRIYKKQEGEEGKKGILSILSHNNYIECMRIVSCVLRLCYC